MGCAPGLWKHHFGMWWEGQGCAGNRRLRSWVGSGGYEGRVGVPLASEARVTGNQILEEVRLGCSSQIKLLSVGHLCFLALFKWFVL